MRVSIIALVAGATLLVTACGSDSSTPAEVLGNDPVVTSTDTPVKSTTTVGPTTTVDPLLGDVGIIKDLWRSYSDSWFAGTEVGVQFIAEHNHPGFFDTVDALVACYTDVLQDEVIVDGESVEADPDWRPSTDFPIDGRIYIATMEYKTILTDGTVDSGRVEAHTVVRDDGSAYFFFGCGDEPPTSIAPVVSQTPTAPLMPAVVCMNLQDAQDYIQTFGVFYSRSEDATGAGRSQIIDSNWVVVAQYPDAGTPFGEGDALLYVVKYGESPNPC